MVLGYGVDKARPSPRVGSYSMNKYYPQARSDGNCAVAWVWFHKLSESCSGIIVFSDAVWPAKGIGQVSAAHRWLEGVLT